MSFKSKTVRGVSLFVICVLALGAYGVWTLAQAQEAPAEAKYIGAAKCKMCHMKGDMYKSWEESKHAKAWEALLPEEQTKEECVKCHVTGFGQATGYKVGDEATKNLTGVQCEACHGPGSEHAAAAAKKSSDEAAFEKSKQAMKDHITKTPVCIGCHNPHKNFKAEAEKMRAGGAAK